MPKPYFHLGLILRRTKEYSESEKMFKKAIELDSEYANAYNSLGVLYQEIG